MALQDELTKKMGPLPTWGWLALATGGAYLYYRHSQSTSTAAASSSGTAANLVPESDIPQFVIQNQYAPPAPSTSSGGSSSNPPANTPGANVPVTDYKKERKVGSGYNANNQGGFVGRYSGYTYSFAGKAEGGTLAKLLKSGKKVFYQDNRGQAKEITNANQVTKGTPLYVLSSTNKPSQTSGSGGTSEAG